MSYVNYYQQECERDMNDNIMNDPTKEQKNDRNFVLDRVKKSELNFLNCPSKYRGDKEIGEIRISKNVELFENCHKKLKNNKNFLKKIVRFHKKVYLYFDQKFQHDKDIVDIVLYKTFDGYNKLWICYKFFPYEVRNDRNLLLWILKNELKGDFHFDYKLYDATLLEDKFLKDDEIMELMLKLNFLNYKHRSENVQTNIKLILEIFDSSFMFYFKDQEKLESFKMLKKEVFLNKESVFKLLKIEKKLFPFLPETLLKDEKFIKKLLEKNFYYYIDLIDKSFLNDFKFVSYYLNLKKWDILNLISDSIFLRCYNLIDINEESFIEWFEYEDAIKKLKKKYGKSLTEFNKKVKKILDNKLEINKKDFMNDMSLNIF